MPSPYPAGSGSLKFRHTDQQAAAQLFARKVEGLSQGRYKVQVFCCSQLGNDPKNIEQLALGGVDFTVSSTSSYAPHVGALNLTMLPHNLEGLGIRFVASPRHADLLLVMGSTSRHMTEALRRTYDATPAPKLVVAIGDCGCTGGIFGCSYASCGRVADIIPVDAAVPGCPPPPIEILRGILRAAKRGGGR